MITEITADVVQAASTDTTARVVMGAHSVLGPVSTFEVELSDQEEPRRGAEAIAHVWLERLEPTGRSLAPSPVVEVLDDVAQASIERARTIQSSSRAWVEAGRAGLASRRFEVAREAFLKALELDPSDRRSLLGLARVAKELGDLPEATGILERLVTADPSDVEARAALALALVGFGRIADAVEQLRFEASRIRRNASYFAVRGGLKLARGNTGEAIRDLRVAVRLRPDWVHVRNVLGIAEASAGNVKAAEQRFQEALRIGPFYLEALLNLVRVLVSTGRWSEAFDQVDRRLSPANAPFEIGLAAGTAAIESIKPRVAQAWLEPALGKAQTASQRSLVLNNLGVAAERLGKDEEALTYFDRAVREQPSDLAIANYAKILIEQGFSDHAASWLRRMQSSTGICGPRMRNTLAVALYQTGDFVTAVREAEALVREIGETEAAEVGTYAVLSCAYADGIGNYDRAIDTARHGLMLTPEDPTLLNNLAYALLMNGQVQEGGEVMEGLIGRAIPTHQLAYVMATRGLLALRRGDLASGWQLYEDAAKLAIRPAVRERVKAKRDLEMARAILRSGGPVDQAITLLTRASASNEQGRPYSLHATNELRRIEGQSNEATKRS